jgi:hypothetical protein
MRITVRAVCTASTSALSCGEETLAKRWMTAPAPTLLASDGAGSGPELVGGDGTRASAGAGRLSAAGGVRNGARSSDTVRASRAPYTTSGSRISTGRTKRRTL